MSSFQHNFNNPASISSISSIPSISSSTTTPRRQKHSCDQCRHGKRACDAGRGVESPLPQVCSNCQRTNKLCTFEWLKSLEAKRPPERKRRRGVESARSNSIATSSTSQEPRNQESFAQIDEEYADSCQLLTPGGWVLQQEFNPDPTSDLAPVDTSQDGEEYDTMESLSTVNTQYSPRSTGNVSKSRTNSTNSTQRRRSAAQLRGWDGIDTRPGWGLGATTSRRFMTDGLLRIYHDSMENALSCWLTEHNCPYTMVKHKRNRSKFESSHAAMEWGSMWSNRMHARVCHLDQAYSSIRRIPLTRKQEHLATHALNLSILAFSSQWAQAGERSTSPSEFEPLQFPQSDVFGRSMQETLWHQASRVLHEAAGIESFKVVFALIVFSLTQRPIDIEQSPSYRSSSPPSFQDLQQITEGDEAPLLLEMALRQMHAVRRKLESIDREQPSPQGGCKHNPLRQEDRETFNLLYWLCVMFDTLSAAMCHRPLVVEDEDSDLPIAEPGESMHCSQQTSSGPREWIDPKANENLQATNDLWGDRFMFTEALNYQPTRWPCSYQVGASTLSSAAPVKVLLFRRVARLQTLLSRNASASKLESAIKDTFQVYDHWNRVYNPFILDCVVYHDELPPRIQSWYILLAGHWHLASFLLSDLIATIDSTNLSLPIERQARQTSQLVPKLQRENALAVANMSRSSLHGSQDRSFQNAREFHFALNKAALLTEPWTVVLIRSLSRAGYILADIAIRDPSLSEQIHARSRCGDCVEALWFLGRKSDMAFLAGKFLSDMLCASPISKPPTHVPGAENVEKAHSTSMASDGSNSSDPTDLSSTFSSISNDFDNFFSASIDMPPNLDMSSYALFEVG